MDLDFHSTSDNRKRTAEDTSTTTEISALHSQDPAPRVLRRYHHRHRNVASEMWGLDISSSQTDSPPRNDTQKRPFSVYKAILRHNNLFFQFALRLPYSSIIDLYAIDKEFHYRLNKYSVSLIHDYARRNAHLAGHIFSWVLYPQLCISDPMLRPMNERQWLARDVPGFRWIGMILWRQNIVRSILTILGMEGHRVPAACEATLMKFWCLMEMKSTKLRLSFLNDKEIWADADIINFQLLLVKLDMRFSDPVLGNGCCQLASMLLSQKSLSTLWKVLSGKLKLNYEKTTNMVAKTYHADDVDIQMQVLIHDLMDGEDDPLGPLAHEGWHRDGAKMEHAVDMVIAEGIRRDLHVQKYYVDFILYGFTDERTGKNVPLPRQLRGEKNVKVPSGGWPEKKLRDDTIKELDVLFGVVERKKGNTMDIST
ncbi:hypothetical protein GGP41_007062 [Bipolaris sorokiniana]|uniref:Uncharacterized protein n=2 Tax=Cochliobolus sativus TaxID=45130 RepID=A0A8H5ZSD5_COCSA|nr:uncharacterized protein COCSADRAFT_33998 [Bipolaris sorokiniana ND90Pr]EMD67134.1 hypothetical protein COCSADRAFT_33998 [Bipolaris sorokiniana ND90Pr]KAF5854259.1 hypothetical protein GGP41_007062 [Bipolaris sorokiniana]